MRFGTFHIQNNLFESTNNRAPSAFIASSSTPSPPVNSFEYHFGIYNQSKALVSQNVFKQDGLYPADQGLIFTFKDLIRADIPAKLCVEAKGNANVASNNIFNGVDINLEGVAEKIFGSTIDHGLAVEGGLVLGCKEAEFSKMEMPKRFQNTQAVEGYVLREAGSH